MVLHIFFWKLGGSSGSERKLILLKKVFFFYWLLSFQAMIISSLFFSGFSKWIGNGIALSLYCSYITHFISTLVIQSLVPNEIQFLPAASPLPTGLWENRSFKSVSELFTRLIDARKKLCSIACVCVCVCMSRLHACQIQAISQLTFHRTPRQHSLLLSKRYFYVKNVAALEFFNLMGCLLQ